MKRIAVTFFALVLCGVAAAARGGFTCVHAMANTTPVTDNAETAEYVHQLGQAEGNHWGDAVTLLQTTSATPFFFNFHHGDLGNFSVILAAQTRNVLVSHRSSPRT